MALHLQPAPLLGAAPPAATCPCIPRVLALPPSRAPALTAAPGLPLWRVKLNRGYGKGPKLCRKAVVTASLSGQGAGSLRSGGPQLWKAAAEALARGVDGGVLGSTVAASANLFVACAVVANMQATGYLPEANPQVLSQVAFRVLIPAFLMSKVATTLGTSSNPKLLLLPLLAILQIAIGAGVGKLACWAAYRRPPLSASKVRAPSPGAAAVAASVAVAAGAPEVGAALAAPQGIGATAAAAPLKEALITTACAFGNSVTLPLVLLAGLLTPAELDRAAGYLALFMVGWSPTLWTGGYALIAAGSAVEEEMQPAESPLAAFLATVKRVMNPPIYGVLAGLLIGGTPLARVFMGKPNVGALTGTPSPAQVIGHLLAGCLRPVLDAASLLGSATVGVQAVVLASSLAASFPAGLVSSKSSTRPTSTKVSPASVTVEAGNNLSTILDGRAFWVVSGVRLVAMPIINLGLVALLRRLSLVPPDPLCALLLLVQSAMPTAQNLVLLAQLRPSTRPLAGMLAGLLLKQYALSLLPITMWMAIFLAFVGK